jgi:hypothetical protein
MPEHFQTSPAVYFINNTDDLYPIPEMLRGYVRVPIQYLSCGLCVYSCGLWYFTRSAR